MTVRWNVFSRIPEMVKKLLFFGTKIENIGVEETYLFLIMTMTSGHHLFLARVDILEVL